ncbi:LamG domain-containing protein [Paraflavitalea sp. CAU 1676]|uniref:LamG domain-containing protein n=1 Tax=Paraflavitalea sp. CAU 1676 TaxID=3032598 RepID=UPI0023DA8C17|nr:LamG domain-containing protein [Paraflavitalea sp. CAU 1676]MDF2189469.1 LamG domain-containing protein [Paraflavitalea sp. CAU 1676]
MRLLKALSGSLLIYLLFFTTGTQITSCQKDPLTDTLIIKDTIIIRDTVDCNCYDLTSGLVAWYNFKDGNLNDASGKGNHIVFNNATKAPDRFGKANGAYLFNGTSNFMQVANSASLNPTSSITISAVFKANDFYPGTCYGNQILAKTDNSDKATGYYAISLSNFTSCYAAFDPNRVKVMGVYGDAMGANANAISDSNFVKRSEWYSVVYTYENLTARIYINGELKSEKKYAQFSFVPNSGSLYLGKNLDSQYPYWFNGVIDDVRIYNRALCSGEVKQLNRSND